MSLMNIYYANPEKYPIITEFLANKEEELGPVEKFTEKVDKEPQPLFPEYFNLEKLEKDNEQARTNK